MYPHFPGSNCLPSSSVRTEIFLQETNSHSPCGKEGVIGLGVGAEQSQDGRSGRPAGEDHQWPWTTREVEEGLSVSRGKLRAALQRINPRIGENLKGQFAQRTMAAAPGLDSGGGMSGERNCRGILKIMFKIMYGKEM